MLDLSTPQVMGILNVTPDSFYAGSRLQTDADIAARAEQILGEGGTMIDVGGCSTRPGAGFVPVEEEKERVRRALRVVRSVSADVPVSVDTFRSEVARLAVEEWGADIVNDVSGGEMDGEMFPTVARLRVPYVLTHNRECGELMPEVILYFSRRVQELRDMGHNDIILDPGYGFSKSLRQNFLLLSRLEELMIHELPLLVGVSRKSMVYRTLDVSPSEALNGTTVLNTVALMMGANILRVHDVRECVEAVRLVRELQRE